MSDRYALWMQAHIAMSPISMGISNRTGQVNVEKRRVAQQMLTDLCAELNTLPYWRTELRKVDDVRPLNTIDKLQREITSEPLAVATANRIIAFAKLLQADT